MSPLLAQGIVRNVLFCRSTSWTIENAVVVLVESALGANLDRVGYEWDEVRSEFYGCFVAVPEGAEWLRLARRGVAFRRVQEANPQGAWATPISECLR